MKIYRPLLLAALSLLIVGSGAFAVVPDADDPPGEVLATAPVHLPVSHPGQTVTVTKTRTPDGRIELRTDLPGEPSVDTLLEQERRAARARYGNLGPELRQRFDRLGADETVSVLVHPARPPVFHLDKYQYTERELQTHSLSLLDLPPLASPRELALRYGRTSKAGRPAGTPELVLEVDRSTLELMRFDPDIAEVSLYREREPLYPLYDIVRAAFNPEPMPSDGRGAGVNAATIEKGLRPTEAACWGVTAPDVDIDANGDDHTQLVFASLFQAAPAATHHHHDHTGLSPRYDDLDAENFLTSHGIQTTSISYSNSVWGPDDYEYRLMDDYAYRWPFPVFVNPAGNNTPDLEVYWQHYNGLSVGNVRHFENRYYEMANCSRGRNPEPVYGSPLKGSVGGDWELPHLLAPGIHPFDNDAWMTDQCLVNGPLWCGTSVSAPIANGIAASVIGADSRMVGNPEGVKAALMVTARNVEDGYWDPSVDGEDGTGVISGFEAVDFAKTHATAVEGTTNGFPGLGNGSLRTWQEGHTLVYVFNVPSQVPEGHTLRIVLTWTSNPDMNHNMDNSLSDLDLTVVGGPRLSQPFGTSASLDSNVEVVEIPSEDLYPGQSISVFIDVTDVRIPPLATADFFYYAVAWDMVADQYFPEPANASGTRYGVINPHPYLCSDQYLGSAPGNTAHKRCQDLGYTGAGEWQYESPQGGVHTYWNGSSWVTTGNSNVCYLKQLRCESTLLAPIW